MSLLRKKFFFLSVGVALGCALWVARARGSDHADTPEIAGFAGGDLTDVYIFPNPTNAANVVLVMNVHPLLTKANAATTVFDPNVLYQFKIDTTGDFVEDLVMQAKFTGTDPATQVVQIAGPVKPSRIGTDAVFETPDPVAGKLNTPFTLSNGAKVFCGPREDPFFFDLEQFFKILPDRETPINGVTDPTPNTPKFGSFRNPGVDFLKGFNVLSIVVELPKSKLGNGKINLWCTTSR